ncbi:MAG: M24 family metallopeptidase, partial [Nocardioidaceae bacterium]
MTSDLRQRLRRASNLAAEHGIDAMLVSPSADLRYLTGYHAKPLERLTCLVLPSEGDPVMVVPLLERASAEAFGVTELGVRIVTWDETDDPYALAARHIPGARPTIAFDNHMWAEKVLAFEAAMPTARTALAGDVLGRLRMRKSEPEIDLLRDAASAIDRVHARMGEWLRPGRTEHEVAADIAYAILEEGHVSADFVIVGSGPNGASPHHDVSDRVIEPDEPVVVDIGGTTPLGYCSDSTRTYVTGADAPQEFRDYYAVLVEA